MKDIIFLRELDEKWLYLRETFVSFFQQVHTYMCKHTHTYTNTTLQFLCAAENVFKMWMNWGNTCMWRYRKTNESISPVSLALSFYACVVSSALCLSSKLNYSFDVAIRDGFSPLCRDHLRFWNMFCKGTLLYLRGSLQIHTHTNTRADSLFHLTLAQLHQMLVKVFPDLCQYFFFKRQPHKQPEGLITFPTNSWERLKKTP